MKALRWHGAADLRLEEVEVPEPGRGEVTVAVAYCGVCGSDLHEVASGPHAIPVARPHSLSHARAPITLGHEFSGTVAARGPGVDFVREGDAAAVEPNYRCGKCTDCREGRYQTCAGFGFVGLMGDGGLAEYVTLPAYMLRPLPEGFDLAAAAVLEPAAVALHSVRRSSVEPGQVAVVIGLGPVGLLVCALLTNRGAGAVIGVDPLRSRRDLALRLGADQALDPGDDVAGSVRAATGRDGAHVGFEVVGNQSGFDTAMSSVRSGGEVVLLGLTPTLTLRAFEMVNAELTLTASVGYRDCHDELIGLAARGELDLAALISSIIDLDAAPAALLRMAAGELDGVKTLVRCDARRKDSTS